MATSRPSRSDATNNSGRGNNAVSTKDNNGVSTSRPSRNTADDSRTREANNTRATVPSRTAEPSTGEVLLKAEDDPSGGSSSRSSGDSPKPSR